MSILQISVSSSILLLFIIVIRSALQNKLPQKTFIILWGVALFRLLIPITVPSQFSIFTLIKKVTSLPDTQNIGISSADMGIAEIMSSVQATRMNGTVQMLLSPQLILWLIGMLTVALFITITHLRCRQSYKMALPMETVFLTKWKKEHPTRRIIQIKQSDKITTPLTYGIIRPVILLPKSMNDADECKLQYVLAHEFTHIKRFDVLFKCLLAASLCVHWYNPLVWVMYVLANRDIEISCDEAVVKAFGETTKSAYALTLISLEEKKSRLTPLCNHFSKNALEERITSIMKIKKTSVTGIALAFILIAGTTTVFATSASAETDYPDAQPAPSNSKAFVKTEYPMLGDTTLERSGVYRKQDGKQISTDTNNVQQAIEVSTANAGDIVEKTLNNKDTLGSNVVYFNSEAEWNAHMEQLKANTAKGLNRYAAFEELYNGIDLNAPITYVIR